MNPLSMLQSALYVISEALLYPVMALLLVFFAMTIFRTGEILAEWLRRRPVKHPEPAEALAFLEATANLSALAPAVRKFISAINDAPALAPNEIFVAHHLQKSEVALNRELAKLRRLVRLGPMLGLMGTLIPMGLALAALTEGEMDKMANSLIIAFTTTVVGLFVAGVSYVLSQIKAAWISEDRRTMELLAEFAVAENRGLR